MHLSEQVSSGTAYGVPVPVEIGLLLAEGGEGEEEDVYRDSRKGEVEESGVPHSLQYIYTAITPTFNCTAVGLVNGEQIVYYDSNTKKMIPKTEWVKKIEVDDPQYWKIQTEHMQNQLELFQDNLQVVIQSFSHAKGVHTLLKMYGCELGENSTSSGHYQYSYDQKDFFHLDLKTGTWTPADEKAEIFIEAWDPEGEKVKYWKDFLETDCVDWLKKYPIDDMQVWGNKVQKPGGGPGEGPGEGSVGGPGGGSVEGRGGGSVGGPGGMQSHVIVAVVMGLFLFIIVV
ncbi:class I histocompatibility antigen, F10 alpha chain-like [Silurus meridionalis]|uniref:class I histocompatibility antigen, F10 alpha chain-like n=1 Tax=Silurus meridionalis TaxID=175797 RepID=UPI001EEBAD0A|nr:class I histocompatibility antigen, F10 alpha chain-like [Silurus meridionalis]